MGVGVCAGSVAFFLTADKERSYPFFLSISLLLTSARAAGLENSLLLLAEMTRIVFQRKFSALPDGEKHFYPAR